MSERIWAKVEDTPMNTSHMKSIASALGQFDFDNCVLTKDLNDLVGECKSLQQVPEDQLDNRFDGPAGTINVLRRTSIHCPSHFERRYWRAWSICEANRHLGPSAFEEKLKKIRAQYYALRGEIPPARPTSSLPACSLGANLCDVRRATTGGNARNDAPHKIYFQKPTPNLASTFWDQ